MKMLLKLCADPARCKGGAVGASFWKIIGGGGGTGEKEEDERGGDGEGEEGGEIVEEV